jgi:GH25 family lysozyme M1 (1,4-beta-N-acetylmuramidase)
LGFDQIAGGAQSKFNLYRNGKSGQGTLIYSGTALTYTDSGLGSATSYIYYVYAVNGNNGKLIAVMEKMRIWQYIALGTSLGLVLFIVISLILKNRRSHNLRLGF